MVLQYFGAERPIFSFERNAKSFAIAICVVFFTFPVLVYMLNSLERVREVAVVKIFGNKTKTQRPGKLATEAVRTILMYLLRQDILTSNLARPLLRRPDTAIVASRSQASLHIMSSIDHELRPFLSVPSSLPSVHLIQLLVVKFCSCHLYSIRNVKGASFKFSSRAALRCTDGRVPIFPIPRTVVEELSQAEV